MVIAYSQNDTTKKLIVASVVDEKEIEITAGRIVPVGRPYNIFNSLDIDNYFFDAYEFENNEVKLNVSKAKEIHLNNFRKTRVPLLENLDIEFLRAVEYGGVEKQKEISVKKMILREVTKTELPNDPKEIKKTWPAVLGTNPYV